MISYICIIRAAIQQVYMLYMCVHIYNLGHVLIYIRLQHANIYGKETLNLFSHKTCLNILLSLYLFKSFYELQVGSTEDVIDLEGLGHIIPN